MTEDFITSYNEKLEERKRRIEAEELEEQIRIEAELEAEQGNLLKDIVI